MREHAYMFARPAHESRPASACSVQIAHDVGPQRLSTSSHTGHASQHSRLRRTNFNTVCVFVCVVYWCWFKCDCTKCVAACISEDAWKLEGCTGKIHEQSTLYAIEESLACVILCRHQVWRRLGKKSVSGFLCIGRVAKYRRRIAIR